MKETTNGFDESLLKAGEKYSLSPDQEKFLVRNGKAEFVEPDDSGSDDIIAEAMEKWEKTTSKKFRDEFPTVESYVEHALKEAGEQ